MLSIHQVSQQFDYPINPMLRPTLIAMPLTLAIACAPLDTQRNFVSDARPAAAVGEAQRCINTSLISRQTVQDDRTIDFRLGATTYRNTLPSPCPRLGSLRSIAYEPLAGQLCANQTIRVIDPIGGGASQGAVCGLGEFVPVEYVDRETDSTGS